MPRRRRNRKNKRRRNSRITFHNTSVLPPQTEASVTRSVFEIPHDRPCRIVHVSAQLSSIGAPTVFQISLFSLSGGKRVVASSVMRLVPSGNSVRLNMRPPPGSNYWIPPDFNDGILQFRNVCPGKNNTGGTVTICLSTTVELGNETDPAQCPTIEATPIID